MAKNSQYNFYINGKRIKGTTSIEYNTRPIPVIIDQVPRRLDLFNQVIIYRITVYRNVLNGFEIYCN